jgi:putative Holliday junction resolvase
MIVRKPAELAEALAPDQRLLGLDLGTKIIGLATSDPGLVIATPFTTLRRRKFTATATELDDIIARKDIGGLVVGYPLNMDGSEGPAAQSARQFAANLDKAGITIPALLWDERLSTVAVTRTLLEADTSRKRRAEVVDKLAAAYILQGVLAALAASLAGEPKGGV